MEELQISVDGGLVVLWLCLFILHYAGIVEPGGLYGRECGSGGRSHVLDSGEGGEVNVPMSTLYLVEDVHRMWGELEGAKPLLLLVDVGPEE